MAEPASKLTERRTNLDLWERDLRHGVVKLTQTEAVMLVQRVRDLEAALEQAEHDVIGLSTSVARLEAALEQAERDKASLRLEIEAWKHNGKKDNEYLLGKLEQAEKALQAISDIGIEMGGEPYDWEQDIYDIAREALAVLGGQDKQEET